MSSNKPKISICVPIHDMKNGDVFLKRLKDSLEWQFYENYELIITKEGKMAENTNAAIKRATGDIIKILYMDDYLAHPGSLQDIVDEWPFKWLVSGCCHFIEKDKKLCNEHYPVFDDRITKGINTIGSPSVLAFENNEPLLFNEELSWTLDVDLYQRLYERYGLPTILNDVNVTIGLHDGQTTYLLSKEDKIKEENYVRNK